VRQVPNRTQINRVFAEGVCEVQKIFVFAYHDAIVSSGVISNGSVRCPAEVHVENMLAMDAARSEKPGESRRELVIHQKPHNACRTV